MSFGLEYGLLPLVWWPKIRMHIQPGLVSSVPHLSLNTPHDNKQIIGTKYVHATSYKIASYVSFMENLHFQIFIHLQS